MKTESADAAKRGDIPTFLVGSEIDDMGLMVIDKRGKNRIPQY